MSIKSKADTSQRKIDRIDQNILAQLQKNARMSNKELAKLVNLSPTPCLRRVALLEKAGVIRRYKAILDPRQLGYTIRAFVSIKRTRDSDREAVWEQIKAIPEVISCHVVSGEFDILVELMARDMDHYGHLLLQAINKVDGVYDSRTTFSMKALKTDGDFLSREAEKL